MASPTFQVFVSSTWEDLQPERKAVREAVERLRETKVVGMEYFGSREETTEHASLDEVDRSHLYLCIIGGRYGSGITEKEYRRAREKGLPCRIYFKAESSITLDKAEKNQKQRDLLDKLKEELRRAHTVKEFASPDQLATEVTADLHDWLSEARPAKPPAAVPAFNALHQLPSPPRDFTGRQEELDELMPALKQGGVTISGLQGLGGVGKTTLALKLAQQLTPHYPDAQFYLDLKGTSETPLAPADAMAHVIRAYQPDARPPQNEAELGGLYRSLLHNQRALLLMDNAAGRDQVEPLVPPESCVMLVTSRQYFTLAGLVTKNLDTLPAEDARQLLLKIAPRIGERAGEIAKLCGYLPLALRLAASALAEFIDLDVREYVQRLTDARQRLKILSEVEASLGLSYELLSAERQERWRILAVFPDTFDRAAAAAVWEAELDAAQGALSELVKYNFLEWNKATGRYRLHDLARLFADARLSVAERDQGQRRHATHYLGVSQETRELYLQGGEAFRRALVIFDTEWRNIQAGQAWAAEHADTDDAAALLCNGYPNAGLYLLYLRQSPRDRITWREAALRVARRLKDRVAEGWHLGNLGIAHYELGEVRRAIEYYEKHLVIARDFDDRRGEGQALNNLALAYNALGERARAIELYEQRLAITREIGDLRGEGSTLGNMGITYYDLGDTGRAIELHEKALAINRKLGNQWVESQNLSNLAIAYRKMGDTGKALELQEAALHLIRAIGDIRSEGDTLWDMAQTLDRLGKRAQAIACAEEALKSYRQIEQHSDVARVRRLLAAWSAQGE